MGGKFSLFFSGPIPQKRAHTPQSTPDEIDVHAQRQPDSKTVSLIPNQQTAASTPILSSRGQEQLEKAGPATLFALETRSDTYDADTNPKGSINFGIAENGLMVDVLSEFYEKHFKLSPLDYVYTDTISGTSRLLKAVCAFLNTHFDPHPSIASAPRKSPNQIIPSLDSSELEPSPGTNSDDGPLHYTHLLAGSGAGVVISQFVRAVADSNDGVLIVGPYYGSFDRDVTLMNDVKCINVRTALPTLSSTDDGTNLFELEENMSMKEIDRLEETYKKSEEEGTKIRAVVLCNPHNPIGRCYPRSVLIAYAQFCERHNLHLLSDELYAFTLYTSSDFPTIPEGNGFYSILSFDWKAEHGVDPGRIHMLYGMSKDFHSNGFRVATLVSPFNPDLILSIRTTSPFMMVSTPADLLFTAVLNDRKFLGWFLEENKRRLREAYEFAVGWFRWHGVGYIPAYAGQYMLINLRPFLEDSPANKDFLGRIGVKEGMGMAEREMALVMHGVGKYKVNLASGTAFHMSEGGWVRFTFSMERGKCVVGMRRLEEMMGWKEAPLLAANK